MDEHKDPGAGPSDGAGDGEDTKSTPAEHTEAGSGEGQGGEGWREERARLLAENEQLKRGQGAGAGGDTATTDDSDRAHVDARLRETQEQLRVARRLADDGDTVSKVLVATLEATAKDLKRMQVRIDIADYVSELEPEHRKPFKAYLKTNGNRFGDLDAAFDAYEATLLRGQRDKSKTAQERAEALTRSRENGHVGDSPRSVPSSEHKSRVMSESDYDAKVEALHAEGRFEEGRALARKLRDGHIVFSK